MCGEKKEKTEVKKGFWASFWDKLDKKMAEKAGDGGCCCAPKSKDQNKSSCC